MQIRVVALGSDPNGVPAEILEAIKRKLASSLYTGAAPAGAEENGAPCDCEFCRPSPAQAFTFRLHQSVALKISDERGEIIGRAEFSNSVDHYKVRYVAGDGRQVEDWLAEDAIRSVDG